jgi:hypothetical protein
VLNNDLVDLHFPYYFEYVQILEKFQKLKDTFIQLQNDVSDAIYRKNSTDNKTVGQHGGLSPNYDYEVLKLPNMYGSPYFMQR